MENTYLPVNEVSNLSQYVQTNLTPEFQALYVDCIGKIRPKEVKVLRITAEALVKTVVAKYVEELSDLKSSTENFSYEEGLEVLIGLTQEQLTITLAEVTKKKWNPLGCLVPGFIKDLLESYGASWVREIFEFDYVEYSAKDEVATNSVLFLATIYCLSVEPDLAEGDIGQDYIDEIGEKLTSLWEAIFQGH